MLEVEGREVGYLQLALLEGTDHHLQAAVAHVHKRHIARFLSLSWQILLVKPVRKGSWRSDQWGMQRRKDKEFRKRLQYNRNISLATAGSVIL